MSFIGGLILGIIIGTVISIFMVAILSANTENDDEAQMEYLRSLREDKNEF